MTTETFREPKREKPTPQQVYKLMEEYTRIDYLMAETILMQTEQELEHYLAMPTENNVNE